MIQAYTHDIRRNIKVTPVQDVEGEPILAKIYLDGCFKGIANTVGPDPDSAQVILSVSNSTDASIVMSVTVFGKERFSGDYTQIYQQPVNVESSVTGTEKIVTFDPTDYDDFKASIDLNGIIMESLSITQRQFASIEGLAIGGKAGQEIVVPCDFRQFEPDEDYTIVFIAEESGVIAKDILTLFAKDGYSFEVCQIEPAVTKSDTTPN